MIALQIFYFSLWAQWTVWVFLKIRSQAFGKSVHHFPPSLHICLFAYISAARWSSGICNLYGMNMEKACWQHQNRSTLLCFCVLQRRRHAAAMVWATMGGRGQRMECPIPVTGLWDGGWKKGLLEAVHIVPLFTLTPGLREARGGHMPNSTGGQSCPALSLTSLPAPPSPVRYMSAQSRSCITDTETPLFLTKNVGKLCLL